VLNQRLVSIVCASLLVTACASSSSTRITRSEFEDIPVPKGLNFVDDRSTIIESPTVKAARLIYRGRIEMTSLALAMRTTLEANGWRSVSTTTLGDYGTTQVYEKGGSALQVRLYEGWYYTYVEMTGSRSITLAR
jgi:hypothetical protein